MTITKMVKVLKMLVKVGVTLIAVDVIWITKGIGLPIVVLLYMLGRILFEIRHCRRVTSFPMVDKDYDDSLSKYGIHANNFYPTVVINPATGLYVPDGIGGIDTSGNVYGF